jgi:hypothetical protein
MGVVGRDWETLKRFNLAELYQSTPKPKGQQALLKAEAKPESVTKDEAQAAEGTTLPKSTHLM